ncbi:hypothetical protein FG167_15160 [Lacinutrix sp. WUR7]|uniref:hypothetical protein n=1 Tax=Lacinutrix sp. WUR7 TaxID=2653681 RepID=UPI00193CA238|nr:hypothetical protein [Lacinutrix sp. WUR7]QRM90514.1 hypothetical protein FG167_15160 [Lacinutrix sp. WUR7]
MRNITKPILSQILFTYLLLIFSITAFAQVGIGTTTPASGALLDLDDANRGLLVPRVTITDLATAAPVTAPATGLLVWNLDIGTGVGFYYWDSAAWVPIGGSATANDWTLTGNTITGTEFLGTISNHALNIRSNNVDRMRVQANGQVTVGYGATNALTGDQFSSIGFSAVNGYTTNGYGFWGDATSGIGAIGVSNTGVGLQGQSNSSAAVVGFGSTFGTLGDVTGGVGAQGQATTGDGVRGFSTSGEGVYGDSDSGVGVWGDSTSFDGVWGTADGGNGVYGDSNSGSGVIGISTSGDGAVGISTSGLGVFASSTNADALQAISTSSTGALGASLNQAQTGVAGSSDPIGGFYAILAAGSGVAGEGLTTGVYGVANSTSAQAFGGYFEADGVYSYVGGWQAGPWTARKILGNGTVSTIVKGTNGDLLTMSATETPEILFQDYGIGQLENGTARINIDQNFSKNIRVDTEHPMKVFVQLEGDCNGVFVTNKSANGFDVKELQDGNSNASFSWSIVATRADAEFILQDGRVRISNNGERFQPAPGPMNVKRNKIESKSIKESKTKNVEKKERTPAENIQPKENTIEKVDSKDSDPLTKRVKINSNQE